MNRSKISTLTDARDAWETFFGRFFSSEIPAKVAVDFDPKIREFKPREDEKAKFNPPKFPNFIPDKEFKQRFPQSPDYDDHRTSHSDDFDDFLNGNTVKIPGNIELDQKTLDLVESEILKGNFSFPYFNDIHHIYYSLWLFKQNKITRQQMGTILAMWYVPNKKVFNILDSRGKFTREARNILIPLLKYTAYTKLTEEDLERFRLLIMAAPKSEQIFYLSEFEPFDTSSLRYGLYNKNTWYITKHENAQKNVFLSFGAIDGLQIAKHGVHRAAASRPTVGKIAIETIRSGVEYNSRPTAISIPDSGIEPQTKGIHEHPETPMPVVTAHDMHHSRLHNTIPPEFHMMINHMSQIISNHTKQRWSKLLWEFTDREFYFFLVESEKAEKKSMELTEDTGAHFFEKMFAVTDPKIVFPVLSNQLTDEAISIIWDMIKKPNVWKDLFKVDVKKLSDPYKLYLEKMERFIKISDIKNNCPPELFNLKFRLYCTASNDKIYQMMLGLIDNEILKELKFIKLPKKYEELKNHTVLAFGNCKINGTNTAKLIPLLVERKFDAIRSESIELLKKFKTRTEKSLDEINHGFLDNSLRSYKSFEQKLLFLEVCRDEIIKARNYSRTNPNWDKFFSFFRGDSLTKSQKKHMKIVDEKIIQVISEHANKNKMNHQEVSEFLRYLKMRNPKTAHLYENLVPYEKAKKTRR
jgi:hypothetical protein